MRVPSVSTVLTVIVLLVMLIAAGVPMAATPLDVANSSPRSGGERYIPNEVITYHGQNMIVIPSGRYSWSNSPLSQHGRHLSMDLPAFAMHQTEVTNGAFGDFVRETGYLTLSEEAGDPMTWRTALHSVQDEHPVSFIAYPDAQAFCKHYGLRLPTVYEWEKAAGGPDAFLWPWGNTWDLQRTNSLERAIGSTLPVGAEPQGASPYGLLDMAGNVWEWTSSEYGASDTELGFMNVSMTTFAGERILKGGSWRTLAPGTQVTYRKPAAEEYRRDTTGFRCAVDGTIVAMAGNHSPPAVPSMNSPGDERGTDAYRAPKRRRATSTAVRSETRRRYR